MTDAAIAARSSASRRKLQAGVRVLFLAAIAASTVFVATAFAAPNYPELTGRVTDQAGLLGLG